MEPQLLCPSCHEVISEEDYFCPHCGKKIKDKPVSTSPGKQIVLYLVSFFLPPFGLPWAFRYLKQDDEKSKIIGYVILGLTVISIIINVWLIIAFINQTNSALQTSDTQFNQQINKSMSPLYSQ